MALVKSEDYYLKRAQAASKASREKALADNDALHTSQKSVLEESYNGQISDTQKAYDDSYRENAIQKLINERQVAESMANMGLTDSGLNRTQQTAVQLSYANNKSSIDRQRQAQVDALAQQLAATLSEIDINKSNAATNIKNTYYNQAAQNATGLYNTDVEAETERYKAEQETIQKQYEAATTPKSMGVLTYGMPYSAANGTTEGNIVYTDSNGNTATMKKGSNPYTGTINSDILNEYGEVDTKKVFGNGYQPNNIKGTKLKVIKGNDIVPPTMQCSWRTDGTAQKVFEANGKFMFG